MVDGGRVPDNAVRWKREDRGGHVESFFLKANDPGTDRAFWLKFTVLAPTGGSGTVGEVWAVLFDGEGDAHAAAKRTFPIEETTVEPGATGFRMGDCAFEHGRTAGTLEGADGTTFRWDLSYEPDRLPIRPFPAEWMYGAPLPKFKILSPTGDTRYRGTFAAGEREVAVHEWPGMQGHNWGRAHAERYAWAHCNVFEGSDGVVFEGFSARVRLGPVVTPFVTLVRLVDRDRTYDFGGPVSWVRASSRVDHTAWEFVARDGSRRLEGRLSTSAGRMVGLTYRNPPGDVIHCLNSKIADCDLRLVDGGTELLHARSAGKAALEVAVRESDHPVRMVL